MNYYQDTGKPEPWTLRTAWWLTPLICIFVVAVNIEKKVSVLTWVLTFVFFVIGALGQWQWKQTGKKWNRMTIVATALVIMLIASACSERYVNTPGPATKPAVIDMEWAQSQDGTQCGLGLLANGSAFVAGVTGHPFLVLGITWLAWHDLEDPKPFPADLVQCWNESQENWHQIELYTQCYGDPVLKSTFDDIGRAQAYVNIPTCGGCNIACQDSANQVSPWFNLNSNYCNIHRNPYDIFCWPAGNQSAATVTQPETTQPLPPGFDPPAWDTTVPAPLNLN